MSWSRLAVTLWLSSSALFSADLLPAKLGLISKKPLSAAATIAPIWKEFGFVQSETAQFGSSTVTAYQLKDTTGALALWESLRPAAAKSCQATAFCANDGRQSLLFDGANYVVAIDGALPRKADLDALFKALPKRRETSLPALLTFVPRQDLVSNSARYILGPASLEAFAPELKSVKAGFDQGAEGHLSAYTITGKPVRLALFYYATPEMARLHMPDFRLVSNARAKRSGVLVAVVLNPVSDAQADTLLSRVQYSANITWNDVPPPSPIKPLYQLLSNILYLSGLLSALCLMAGLIYAGMRLYRRRYGSLESEEAMTTLHLHGE